MRAEVIKSLKYNDGKKTFRGIDVCEVAYEMLTFYFVKYSQIEDVKYIYKYKVNDFYSGEEPIDLTLNLGYAYDFDEKNAKDSEKDKFPYKNKDEFSKDAYKIVKTLKKINYDFSNIKIYSFKADGNNAYEVNIKDLNSIKSEADLNEIIKNVDYSK